MRILILTLALLLPDLALAQTDPCQPQAPSIIGVGSTLQLCFNEPADSIDIEIDGTPVRIDGPFGVGVHPQRIRIDACAKSTLRGRSANAAGAGEWGPTVDATFQPCFAPVFLL